MKRFLFRKRRIPTLKFKFVEFFVLFATLPTIALSSFLYININERSRGNGIRSIESAVHQISSQIEALMSSAENTSTILSNDRTLLSAQRDFRNGIGLDVELDYYRNILELLFINNLDKSFHMIRVYLPESRLATKDGVSIFSLSALSEEQLPPALRTGTANFGWTGMYTYKWYSSTSQYTVNDRIITYFHRVITYDRYSANFVIAVDISEASLLRILNSSTNIQGEYYLLDAGSNVLVTTGTEIREDTGLDIGEARPGRVIRYSGADVYFSKMSTGRWQVAALVPMQQFETDRKSAVWITVGTVFICLLMIPMLSNVTASAMIRDIRQLSEHYVEVMRGEYKPVPLDATTREILHLKESHNRMVKTINTLVHDIYEERLARQEAQMISLFEQIKPHFLYNTLESGKWMAMKAKDFDTADFLEKLSQYFRLGLSEGEEFVPVQQELHYARLYVDIINMRAHKQVICDIQIDDGVKNEPVLKLIVQPLVENAVEHGIKEKEVPTGTILVTACRIDGQLEITVHDDGVGMSKDTITKLNDATGSGYGISNVRQRLRLYYGNRCSLRFQSVHPHGTKATITISLDEKM